MRISLIGFDKMGKIIEQIALERGHIISFRSHSDNHLVNIDLRNTDVAIEFTRPELAKNHVKQCLKSELPIVVGTTAWLDSNSELDELVKISNGSVLYSSNFSVGVNIIFKLNELLAKLMIDHESYQVFIEEVHHLQKLDSPSGTAVSLAEGIMKHNTKYVTWSKDTQVPTSEKTNQLPIKAIRIGKVPGTHKIKYQSSIDTIELSHTTHSREGFALGAVIAAEFLVKRKGIYTMSDVLK